MNSHIKKTISMLLLLLVFNIATANVLTTVSNKVDTAITNTKTAIVTGFHKADTSSTVKAIYSDLKEAVIWLAKGLQTSVEHVFYVLVKQQYMLAALDLFKLLVLLFIFWRATVYIKNKPVDWTNTLNADITKVLYLCFSIFFIYLAFYYYLPSIFQRFINPEYPVYLQVIEIVKQLRE